MRSFPFCDALLSQMLKRTLQVGHRLLAEAVEPRHDDVGPTVVQVASVAPKSGHSVDLRLGLLARIIGDDRPLLESIILPVVRSPFVESEVSTHRGRQLLRALLSVSAMHPSQSPLACGVDAKRPGEMVGPGQVVIVEVSRWGLLSPRPL